MRMQELASDRSVGDGPASLCSSRATVILKHYIKRADSFLDHAAIGLRRAAILTLLLAGSVFFIVQDGYLAAVLIASLAVVAGLGAHGLWSRWQQDCARARMRESELVAARDAAEMASRAKSEFLSQMSHEIRTPMNAILGMADLLNDTSLTAEQHKYLSIMINNGGALLDLIDDILDFDRSQSGHLSLETASFDLHELVERVTDTHALRAHQQGLELAVRIKPDVPVAVVGDTLRLRQILVNLIGNALKFTERGEIALTIERAAGGQPGELHFAVSDSGIGIAKDQQEKIFARYTQAGPSVARTYGGSGLGLTIVKQLVGLMDGRIWVESEPGHGSTFNFTAKFQAHRRPPAEATLAPAPDIAGSRMLIAAASATNGLALAEMLVGSGAQVTQVENGEAAIAALRRADEEGMPYHFVWLDCRATATDCELIRRICAAARGAGKVIPMLTSNELNVRLPLLRRMGLLTHVIKPVRRAELLDAIRSLIGGNAHAGGAEPSAHAASRFDQSSPAELSGLTESPIAASAGISITSIEPAEHIGDVRHPTEPIAIGRPLRILVADDSADNRLLIEAFLKKTAAQLDQAENGVVALEKFVAGKYDVVLMDIQMPVMDGYVAAKLIREWERNHNAPRTPIIALTASVLDEAVHKSFDAGCDTHVSKPVRRPILLAAIREVTAHPQRDEASPTPASARLEAMANS
jgi:two-component system sensor histidine kinase/response regulator